MSYATIEEPLHDFDGYILRPKELERSPGIILLHAYNQMPSDMRVYAEGFARNGLVAAVPKYTDASDGVVIAVKALRALKSRSDVDGNRVGLFGLSLGGSMALLASTQEKVEFVIDVGGWVDLADLYRHLSKFPPNTPQKIIADTMESATGTPEENEEIYRLSSPITYVDRITGKVLIIHGEKDDMVPVSQSKLLYEKLKEENKVAELKVVKDAGYLMKGYEDAVVKISIEFLRSNKILAQPGGERD